MDNWLEHRCRQVEALVIALEHLIPLAQKNEFDPWIPALDYCLRFARHLQANGFSQADLNELSGEVAEVFRGGMGSFNDVWPRFDPNEFQRWASETSACGHNLRVILQ